MSKIWSFLIFISLLFSIFGGRLGNLSAATVQGAKGAVEFIISIAGVMCFWSGMMEVMSQSGLSKQIASLIKPILSPIFGKKVMHDAEASELISSNVTANLLGLSNASTPLGLRSAKRIHEIYGEPSIPPNPLIALVVLNTASIQLFPTTVAAIRASLGAEKPYEILLPVWIASAFSVIFGLLGVKFFELREGQKH